jgi:acyl-coenzyme A synthetase/AMP-(fatty) acid ligase
MPPAARQHHPAVAIAAVVAAADPAEGQVPVLTGHRSGR